MQHSLLLRILCGIGIWLMLGSLYGQPLDLSQFENLKARSIGPAGMSGRVTVIDAVTANPDIIYAGTASGGLWKSESGGIGWEPIFDDQPTASIGALAIYQPNPDVVWVGTGEGNPRNSQASGAGIFRSLDGGKNWECMGLEETRNIHRVIIHPDNPDIVYVGAQGVAWGESEHRGVYKTTDGGETWEKILYVNENTGIGDLIIDPSNPNKLIAAMWEFRRWPWYFKSGGEGSGMYVTFDGGKNWKERTSEDGLPGGELGRMGLAISTNNPKVVYALVESKKNALYRSDDGGFKFRKISSEPGIGNRPFYYADIYVDPKNENRVYSIHSTVTWSEDGGKTFKELLGYGGPGSVHPDHHAWYIHPENNRLLMNGNDGGMAISRDMGENWRFVENLPLAQFYHINHDMEMPYNVYGGMQDNGSWKGPAYVWRSGGIRNAYWTELFFGDGFDVVPDPEDARYGYAMSQGGNVGRYDSETGNTTFIKPAHPEGEALRFNWNAAIAQDPHNSKGLYFGSQFVHYSADQGQNWKILSPDLTTNDPEKQKQLESGGLTYDVTQAENHTSILSIAPSALEQDLIWVGTDDGNLQLTRDGGETWTNLIDRLPGIPENPCIPQIHPSTYRANEAFVVVNNYRQNDWNPYLYHTADYGETWTRVVNEDDVSGHCLSIVQDPEAENLLFLGTENGLYISIDKGENWVKFDHDYPTVATSDLKIHPREHDLIIGTFGRAAFVVDDIRPLREVAKSGVEVLDNKLVLFDTPDAVQASYAQASGTRFAANAIYAGQNRWGGAKIAYYLSKPEMKKADKEEDSEEGDEQMEAPKVSFDSIKVEILAAGEVIRTRYAKADTGLNYFYWGMDQKGVRMPMRPEPKDPRYEPGGRSVMPGTYTVRLTYGDTTAETPIRVLHDPRLEMNLENMQARAEMQDAMMGPISQATAAMDRLRDAQKTLKRINGLLAANKGEEGVEDLQKQAKAAKDSIQKLMFQFVSDDTKQGIYRDPNVVTADLWQMRAYFSISSMPKNTTQDFVAEKFKAAVSEAVAEVNAFLEGDWKALETAVNEADLALFKPVESVPVER